MKSIQPESGQTAPERTAGAKPWRAVFALLSFIVGLAMGSVLFTPRPFPEPNFAAKMDLFSVYRPVVEVLPVGASYLESSIDPAVFFEETGFRTFNLSLPGYRGYQMEMVVRTILEDPPPRLKYIILDLGEWPSGMKIHEQPEAPYAHSPEIAFAAVKWSLVRRDWHGAWHHFRAMSLRYLPIASAFALPPRPPSQRFRAREDGFRPLSEATVGRLVGRRNLNRLEADSVEVFEEDTEAVNVARLKQLESLCYRHGVIPVFVRAPIARRFDSESPADYAVLDYVFWYDDPVAHPQYYRKAYRYDFMHLNVEGAEAFTREFARDFVNRIRQDEALPRPYRGLAGTNNVDRGEDGRI